MATSDRIDRFRFNAGEGLDEADFNELQELMRRQLYTELLGYMTNEPWVETASPLANPVCRPFGDALAPVHVPMTATVRITGGFFLFAPTTDPGQPSQWVLSHRLEDTITDTFDVVTTSANADPSDPRNDLLTVKVEDTITDAADDENRDFEDAITRAKTTVSTNKRYRTRATYTVYEGTPGAGDPVTPADEVVIARYVMQPSSSEYLAADIEDLRTPSVWPITGPKLVAIEPLTATNDVALTLTTGQQAFFRIPAVEGMVFSRARVRASIETVDAELTLSMTRYDDGSNISGSGGPVSASNTPVSSGTGPQTVEFIPSPNQTIDRIGEILRLELQHTGTADNVFVYAIDVLLSQPSAPTP